MKNFKICVLIGLLLPAMSVFGQGYDNVRAADENAADGVLNANVFVEAEYDDNVQRSSEDEVSDMRQMIGIDTDYQYSSQLFQVALQYTLHHEEFRDNTYDSETRLEGNSQIQISGRPERYSWIVGHQQTIAKIDSAEARTPDNTDQRGVLTTGPNLYLQLSPVDVLTLSGRYVDVRFDEQDDSDSQRAVAQVSWVHRLSPLSSVGLNASYVDVEGAFERAEYSQQRVGVTFQSELKNGNVSLEVGESWLERNLSTFDDVDGAYASFDYNASWRGTSLGLVLTREVTDSSIGLSQNFTADSSFTDGDTNFDSIDVITRTRYQLNIDRRNNSGRVGYSLTLAHDEEDYDVLVQDQQSFVAGVGLNYSLGQNLDASFYYEYEKIRYLDRVDIDRDETSRFRVGLAHMFSDRWQFDYDVVVVDRRSDALIGRDYDSNAISIRVSYAF